MWKSGTKGINHIPRTTGMPGMLLNKLPESGNPSDLIAGICGNVP